MPVLDMFVPGPVLGGCRSHEVSPRTRNGHILCNVPGNLKVSKTHRHQELAIRHYLGVMRTLPISLGFFLATAVVALLQMIPIIGIFLMFMLAMLWSVLLINAGMLGTALEVLTGRVSRWWLVLPVAFYGGYFAFAAADNLALRHLRTQFDAANAKVTVPFNTERHSLVFDGDRGSWFVENYLLPVVYSKNLNYPEGFRSTRMMASEVCSEVRENPALRAAGIDTLGFHDGDAIGSRKLESRFCDLGMPERPAFPQVTVVRREDKVSYASLPITRVTTTITMPGGQSFQLLGGVAAPLSWIPMPVIGCGLNSGAAKWECDAGFWRNGFTPIVAGDTRYSRDSFALARALGLKRVEIAERSGGDPTLVRAKIAQVEKASLARQLAAIDRMIVDPIAKVEDWQTGVISNHPETLAAKADAIMTGLARAANVNGDDRWKARESGRILARLIAALPRDRFVMYGPRLLALYRANFEPEPGNNRRPQSHWLWESEPLLRRLGDLGPDALFVVVDPRASLPSVNGAGVEAMCRVGAPGLKSSGPVLLNRWRKLEARDRDERKALFVAMRRIGITPPPLIESDEERARRERANSTLGGMMKQRASPMEELTKEWGDVTPASSARICSPSERQARRRQLLSSPRRNRGFRT